MSESLFTYGTLSPGQSNEHLLKAVEGRWEAARVKGVVRFDGPGSALGYPAIVLADEGDDVPGFLFSSENLAAQWGLLDEFEGNGYRRVLTKVCRSDGSRIDAYIYALNEIT